MWYACIRIMVSVGAVMAFGSVQAAEADPKGQRPAERVVGAGESPVPSGAPVAASAPQGSALQPAVVVAAGGGEVQPGKVRERIDAIERNDFGQGSERKEPNEAAAPPTRNLVRQALDALKGFVVLGRSRR